MTLQEKLDRLYVEDRTNKRETLEAEDGVSFVQYFWGEVPEEFHNYMTRVMIGIYDISVTIPSIFIENGVVSTIIDGGL
jgi:hypothetical protein